MKATFILTNDSGKQVRASATEVANHRDACNRARVWASSQTDILWDACTVEIPDLDYIAEVYLEAA